MLHARHAKVDNHVTLLARPLRNQPIMSNNGARSARRSRPSRWSSVCLVSALLLLQLGCGDGSGRVPISGTVTLDGQPLAKGLIQLEPEADEEAGSAIGAVIQRGMFTVPQHEGPFPGHYLVRIYANSGVQASPAPGQSERSPRPMIDLIPDRYNGQSILNIEIETEQSNHFKFELRSEDESSNAHVLSSVPLDG